VAGELVALSEKNEKIANALDYLTEAGPYAGLIVACMPLVLQICANHGLIKAELVATGGVVPPAALESQVKADMARQASEALRAQQEAERELATIAEQMRAQEKPESQPEQNGEAPPRRRRATSA